MRMTKIDFKTHSSEDLNLILIWRNTYINYITNTPNLTTVSFAFLINVNISLREQKKYISFPILYDSTRKGYTLTKIGDIYLLNTKYTYLAHGLWN